MIDTNSVDLATMDVRGVEPPSLYLIRRSRRAFWNDWEEYRIPINQDLHRPLAGDVRAHYSCYRDKAARENDWEYARAVYFEHFTSRLLGGVS